MPNLLFIKINVFLHFIYVCHMLFCINKCCNLSNHIFLGKNNFVSGLLNNEIQSYFFINGLEVCML
jgi:hypothetical protein